MRRQTDKQVDAHALPPRPSRLGAGTRHQEGQDRTREGDGPLAGPGTRRVSSRGSPWRAQAGKGGLRPVLPKLAGYSRRMSAPVPAATRGGGPAREGPGRGPGGRGARARRQVSGAAAGEQRARLARGALPAWPARSWPARARPRSRTARSRPREPREAARGPRRPGAERGTRAGEGDPGAQGMRRRTVAWSPCPTCSCLHPTPANGQILAPWHPGTLAGQRSAPRKPCDLVCFAVFGGRLLLAFS